MPVIRHHPSLAVTILCFGLGILTASPDAAARKRPAGRSAAAPPAARLPAGAHVAGQNGVTIPQVVQSAPPRYPLPAMREEIEGDVELLVCIGVDGAVTGVEVLTSSSPGNGFEEAATEAVANWRYVPALLNGKPVEVYTVVTVGFEPERNRDDRRWAERQQGLRAFAEASLYPQASHVAGRAGVSWPVVRKKRAPVEHAYPRSARMRSIESRVLLLVDVKKDGTVGKVLLAHAERHGHGFEKAAERAVGRWLFEPAMKDGLAIDAWHWIEVAFTL